MPTKDDTSSITRSFQTIDSRPKPQAGSRPRIKSADRHKAAEDLVPDPERPLDADPSLLEPLLPKPEESEPDWVRRLAIEASDPDITLERLLHIREAMLREIGFYRLGTGPANREGRISESDWHVLATLQNVPADSWRHALSMGDQVRDEFEKTGVFPLYGVFGPDGNFYHRLSIREEHPVGGILSAVEQRIREKAPSYLEVDDSLILSALALTLVARRAGMSAGMLRNATLIPRSLSAIRSRPETVAAGLATAAGLGYAGTQVLRERGQSDMDAAPDLPPPPGIEPPEEPGTERESFPADLPPIPPLPGFMPEDYSDLVEIFPDQGGLLPLVDILDNRLGNADTQLLNTNIMRDVRDLAKAIGVSVWHRGGGQPDPRSDWRKPELYLQPSGEDRAGGSYLDVAFESERTGRKLLINTVDTRADNMTLTSREERAAVRILANSKTGDILILIPKPPRGQTYDRDRLLEWLRPHLEEIDRDLPEGSKGHERRFEFH